MSNSFFKFKQFNINQDGCAMKVCTDACIEGAWFARKHFPNARILDIGTGTGLLMLMMAQKHSGEIHGIELDNKAYSQLLENTGASKWKDSLRVFPGDARSFSFPVKYDFIITNPPFYEGDLITSSVPKNLARHSTELTLAALLEVIDTNLATTGSFGILLPYHRMDYFEELAADRLFYLQDKLLVRQTPRHEPFRAILQFSRIVEGSRIREDSIPVTTLLIKDEAGQYTEAFVELLKDYYLYL